MSNVAFPSIPGVFCEGRAPFFVTEIEGAETGPEYRTSKRIVVGYRYTMRAKLRSWLNEDRTLFQFFEARYGPQDSFLFTDRYDGVERRVRFADDDLGLTLSGGVWSGTFELVTVVG